MYVQERLPEIWHVDLVAFSLGVDSTSLRDALLFTGYGILQDSAHETEAPLQFFKNDDTKLIKNTDGWKENEIFDVTVSHIIDPENIYVQKVRNFCLFYIYYCMFIAGSKCETFKQFGRSASTILRKQEEMLRLQSKKRWGITTENSLLYKYKIF